MTSCDANGVNGTTELCKSDQNEVKHDFFSHVKPLVPVLLSCDGHCIINDTICLLGQDD